MLPAPGTDIAANATAGPQTVVFAGGCFWGVQAVFQHVKGVRRATSGYAGDKQSLANYPTVSSGDTKHAESVEVVFDPQQVSFGKLLQIFFSVVHDPTQLNRQGPDSGTQYRSEIFFTSPEQQRIAAAYIQQLQGAKVFRSPIVTKLEPLPGFYAAEEYHQNYLQRHPNDMYIVVNDAPKVANLKRSFPDLYAQL
jgi:peptide-methionine (S)-S-oxide reductase